MLARMLRVIPPPLDYSVNAEAWEEIVQALNARGLAARLEEPQETRSADLVADVGIYLAQYVGTEVLNAIRDIVLAKLRGTRQVGSKRRVPIWAPDGKTVLTVVDVPSAPQHD